MMTRERERKKIELFIACFQIRYFKKGREREKGISRKRNLYQNYVPSLFLFLFLSFLSTLSLSLSGFDTFNRCLLIHCNLNLNVEEWISDEDLIEREKVKEPREKEREREGKSFLGPKHIGWRRHHFWSSHSLSLSLCKTLLKFEYNIFCWSNYVSIQSYEWLPVKSTLKRKKLCKGYHSLPLNVY